MRSVLALLLCFAWACADDDSGEQVVADAASQDSGLDAGLDAESPDAGPNGESSGSLKIFASVTFALFPREDGGEPFESFAAFVDVRDLGDQPVTGASVTLSVDRVTATGTPDALPGRYLVTLADAGEELRLHVTRGEDFLTDSRLRVPVGHTITATPDPPLVGRQNDLSWTPVEDGVVSVVQTFDARSQPTHASLIEDPEDGTTSLPAQTFPAAGRYEIRVERETTTLLAGPQSSGKVRLSRGLLVSVPD